MTTPSEEEARAALIAEARTAILTMDYERAYQGGLVGRLADALASRVSTPPTPEPNETPDDSEINDAIVNAESWFDALWEIATKYDVPATNNHPRWQDGRFLRPIGEFIGDIDDAAKKWMAVSTPPARKVLIEAIAPHVYDGSGGGIGGQEFTEIVEEIADAVLAVSTPPAPTPQQVIDEHMRKVAHRVMNVFEVAEEDTLADEIMTDVFEAIGLVEAFGAGPVSAVPVLPTEPRRRDV